jgi:hypothetical protein
MMSWSAALPPSFAPWLISRFGDLSANAPLQSLSYLWQRMAPPHICAEP